MPYNPKEPIWCDVCKKEVTKANLSRHKDQVGHKRRAGLLPPKERKVVLPKSEDFFCEDCGKCYSKGNKSYHPKTPYQMKNVAGGGQPTGPNEPTGQNSGKGRAKIQLRAP